MPSKRLGCDFVNYIKKPIPDGASLGGILSERRKYATLLSGGGWCLLYAEKDRPMAFAYLCLDCRCLHGWIEHPFIHQVTHEQRYSGEHLWYCPQCRKEHRTTDGTPLGQLRKRWREIVDVEQYLHEERERLYFTSGGFFQEHS